MRFLWTIACVVALNASADVVGDPSSKSPPRVTQKYADKLQAIARATLEENKKNNADLDSAIQRTDKAFYDHQLRARLDQRDPLSDQDQLASSDATLYGFCSEYGSALKNVAHLYFENTGGEDLQYWQATLTRTSKKCECFVEHPAGVKEIRAHRAVVEGNLPYEELESANDRYKQYLGQCLSNKKVD